MNKARRKEIADLISQLEELKEEIASVRQDEEDYMDSIPENLQGSEKYEKAEEATYNLDEAVNSIDEAICSLETAME